ncbi:uncharacterized protein G2W53_007214 [Senna tora]|uniref:Uncharacterized protein n=1 Tax=Senna tora TaxID=362788 RepID=A0A834X5P9_9FABA|nr:uncharacterized protein G2W53_007214 [Senna tora]
MPKDLGPWVKAINGGRKIPWPSEGKVKQTGMGKEDDRRVGMVRKNDTDMLLEKLAKMSVGDGGITKSKEMDTVVGSEGRKVTAANEGGDGCLTLMGKEYMEEGQKVKEPMELNNDKNEDMGSDDVADKEGNGYKWEYVKCKRRW